ncbi:hypothetical protein RHGRI_003157 [Rhododendron griersonianum]|uniref:Uncharacterized protein n=1 Tax=Rhododendron griersonianum TaxID=479676 RepID=A0AAV6L5P2_9ERIC|nr:hypothetical protein RHGRI_003157 [Rhododendron griersonianum]
MSTYDNVIEVFSEAGDVKHMEYTFEQRRAEGMKADTKTFCCLVRGYGNAPVFHKIISTVQLAGKLEIPENTTFCNAVIFACAKAEDTTEIRWREYLREGKISRANPILLLTLSWCLTER